MIPPFPLHLFLVADFCACPFPEFWILVFPPRPQRHSLKATSEGLEKSILGLLRHWKFRPTGWSLYEESQSEKNPKNYHCSGVSPFKSNHISSVATRDSSRKAFSSTIFTLLSREWGNPYICSAVAILCETPQWKQKDNGDYREKEQFKDSGNLHVILCSQNCAVKTDLCCQKTIVPFMRVTCYWSLLRTLLSTKFWEMKGTRV